MRLLLQALLIIVVATSLGCHGAPVWEDSTIERDVVLRGAGSGVWRMEEREEEDSKEEEDDQDSKEEDDQDSDEDDDDDDKDSDESDDDPLIITAPKPLHVPVLVGDDEVALAGTPVLTPEEGELQQSLLAAPTSSPTLLSRRLMAIEEPDYTSQRVVYLRDDEEEEQDEEQDYDEDEEQEEEDYARFLSLPTNTLYGWHGSWKHSRPIIFYPEKNLYTKYDKHSTKQSHYNPHAITYHHGFYTGLY